MNRSMAMEELRLRVENEDIIKHSLAVEAIMRKLAGYFQVETELWGIAGLVHDIDIERIQGNMELHGLMGGDILEGLDTDDTIVYAVRAHNPKNHFKGRRKIDKALYCAEPMSQFITACTFSFSEKKLEQVDTTFVLKQFDECDFAENISREQIGSCKELGLSLVDFVELSLNAMKDISEQLGL